MNRRQFVQKLSVLSVGVLCPLTSLQAKTYLTSKQAKRLIWGSTVMVPVSVNFTKAQMKSIQSASKTRVRSPTLKAWKSTQGDWFLVDQVIGKHENIDIAVGITREGKVQGIEILTYRETYGYEVAHPKWRAQFHGKDSSKVLRLDKDIKNISGATLSCKHITTGINRLTHTWQQVLKTL